MKTIAAIIVARGGLTHLRDNPVEAIYRDDEGRIMQRLKLVKDLTAFSKQWNKNIKIQCYH